MLVRITIHYHKRETVLVLSETSVKSYPSGSILQSDSPYDVMP